MKRTTKNLATPRVIESGDDWYVAYDPSTKDYSAYVRMEYLSSHNTPTEARQAASEYIVDTLVTQREMREAA